MDVQSALDKLRAYGRRGAYHEAAVYAASLPENLRRLPSVALEIGRLRLRQGRVDEAQAALAYADRQRADTAVRLLLSLEEAALRIFRAADINGAVAEAERIWAEAALAQLAEADRAEAERVYARVLMIAGEYRAIPLAVAHQARDRLPVMAEKLIRAGREDESLAARLTWAERLDAGAAQQEALRDLAARALESGRAGLAGEARLSLAERMLATGASTEAIESELVAAESLLAQAGHVHGPIDARRVRAQLAVERAAAHWRPLADCLDEYRAIDYPRGEISLLMDLTQITHERGETEAAADFRQRSLRLAEETGMGLIRHNVRLAQMDALMRSNRYREAIELGQAALAAQPAPSLVASYEQLLSTAYSFVADWPATLRHGRRAVGLFTELGMGESASTAALKLASDLTAARRDEAWDEAETLLNEWLARDEKRGDWAGVIQKRELLAQIPLLRFFFSPTRQGSPPLLDEADDALKAAEALTDRIAGREAARRRGALWQMRGQLRQARGDTLGVEQAWREALAVYEPAGLALEAANCRYIIGALRLNLANQDLMAHFSEAENNLRAALEYYDAAGMRDRAADTRFMFARLYTNAYVRVTAEWREQLLDAALDHLTAGERDYDDIRRDYAVGAALEAQLGKRGLIAKSRQIYELALEIQILARRDAVAAWGWAQRAKARALVDILSGAAAPAAVVERLGVYPDVASLVAAEREFVARLAKATPDERPALRAELDALRQRMRQDPRLADYLELGAGDALDANDLTAMLEPEVAAGRGCVCVDWVTFRDQLWLLATRPASEPQMWPLALRASEAQRFVAHNLTPDIFRDTLRDTPELLREMDALIAPLAECSAGEDLLILAPTGPLHALPLHALELDGEPLLARNPVVYCPSLSALRHCLARRGADKPARTAALFGDPGGDRAEAGDLVRDLAQAFGVAPLVRDAVTRNAFAAHVAGRDLIHFQGHAKHDRDDPLDSHLLLADGRFTARDVFGLQGLQAELVALAACESAASVIATGDEPLGLIPAFLYAGASAVLAALWPVRRDSAAQMMRRFYQPLIVSQSDVDKAQALREAALALRAEPKYSAPYHWAPFALYGAWRH
jgi:CHAT domain-containing protein